MAGGEIEDGATILAVLLLYRRRILPRVRSELGRWRLEAARIPDPELRAAALHSLTEKASNPEATAVFACLAPRRGRAALVGASVAFQVAVDYLDTLGEEPGAEPLADGLSLHRSLVDALSPGAATSDWYAHHPHRDDGGYLGRLVDAVRGAIAPLPSAAAILPSARDAAERCGEGQSRTHAAAAGDPGPLGEWAEGLAVAPGFEWWELGAGGASSAAVHALLALAATPAATPGEAELVDAAYFPSIGALTVLLDDLVDREADREAGEHSFLGHYDPPELLASRLTAIADAADDATRPLRRSARHRAILAGVLAFYLRPPATPASAEAERERLAILARTSRPTRALARALRLLG